MELLPLSVKLILLETVEIDFFRQFFSCPRQSTLLSVAQRSLPFLPAHTVISVLDRHIKGIIFQPVTVFIYKIIIIFTLFKTVICFLEDFKPSPVNLLVIDLILLFPEIICLTFFLCQKPIFDQRLQVNIVRISCKC